MKHQIFTVIFFVITIHSLLGRSEMTQAKYACNMVELAIWDEFLSEGKKLPSSWDDIPSFRNMKKSISTQNLNTLEHINALALVPNAPAIQAGLGISLNHSDRKLFAISRTAEFHLPKSKSNNQSADKGRYAIFVTFDNSQISSSWLLEPEVEIVLKQINDFDPAKQPLAFENLDQLARDKKARQDQSTQEIREHLRKTGKRGSDDQIIPSAQHSKRRDFHTLAWIAGGFMIVAFLVWIALRSRTHR